jgi:hypothetical protein
LGARIARAGIHAITAKEACGVLVQLPGRCGFELGHGQM